MNEDELRLYQAFSSYATENLFWQLTYLNNALFDTPLRTPSREKLESMINTYAAIISSIYPTKDGQNLISAIQNNNHLFICFVDHLLAGSSHTESIDHQWKENGRQTAQLLCKMNPYWRITEWTVMIGHECDLLETIAENMLAGNYNTFTSIAPVCQRLALDMCSYMSSGVMKQQHTARNYAD